LSRSLPSPSSRLILVSTRWPATVAVAAEAVAGEVAVAVAEVAVVAVVDGLEATTTLSATAGGKLLHGVNSPFKQHETHVTSP
jgi:hypothetical protein